MKFIWILLVFVASKSYAQYTFEKYPAKKYDSVSFKTSDINDSTQMAVASYKNYTIKLIEVGGLDGGSILLYFKNKLIKKADGAFARITYATFPLYIEDINNDGRFDFIIATYYGGAAGLASSNIFTTFFSNKGNNRFSSVSYGSFYSGPQKEYQFNHDGKYEIIGQSLVRYKQHNYWLFDLYNYKNGKLVNVGKKYNYPIAVPYLNKETFKATNKIPQKQLQKLSLKQPNLFSARF
jgi:hypothetical protein